MKRTYGTLAAMAVLAISAATMHVLADDTQGPPPGGQQGGGPGGPGGGGGGMQKGPPAGFHLLPKFVEDKLKLTDDQKAKVKALEAETKAKLEALLTPEQVKILETARPPRHGPGGMGGGMGGPGGGQGGPGGGQGSGPGGDQSPPPPPGN